MAIASERTNGVSLPDSARVPLESRPSNRIVSPSRACTLSDALVGERFGRFEITAVAGRGGMGLVFKAREIGSGDVVALKMLPVVTRADREPVRRFLREARLLAKIDHPNIPRIHSMGREGHYYYLATDFVQGYTLAQFIDEGRTFTPRQALEITREVAQALEATHAHGILHRDIKSENIMLDDAGGVKVLDFGIAKDMNDERRLTVANVYLGTPEYCSPEQLAANAMDARTDVYSLGVVLFEMLTGQVPYLSKSTVTLYNDKLRHRRPPLLQLMPGVPKPLERVVKTFLAGDPDRRYQSMQEAVEAIDETIPKLGAFGWGRSCARRFGRRTKRFSISRRLTSLFL